MTPYLLKYVGTYRVKSHIDNNTNDFPRNSDGSIETDDLYIPCSYGCQIYHYGYNILVAYIPSLIRGHNILKSLGEKICSFNKPDGYQWNENDYKELYISLEKHDIIRGVVENDKEIEFKFPAKNIDLIAEYLNPKTLGAGISPFSTKNLPKKFYVIPQEELAEYKVIIAQIPNDDYLFIHHVTNDFIANFIATAPTHSPKTIKNEMKKLMLKGKEFIHYSGYWNTYLGYLRERISHYEKSKAC